MKRPYLLAALLLPLLGLSVGILVNQLSMQRATEWHIPITGYDPRDLLRGQYIRFRYDWHTGDMQACQREACILCLSEHDGAVIARAIPPTQNCAARVDVAASNINLRAPALGRTPQFSARIFVSEASAPAMEELLRERRAKIVARLTPEGRLVPRRIEAMD